MRYPQGRLLVNEWQVLAILDAGLWVQAKQNPRPGSTGVPQKEELHKGDATKRGL